MVTSYPNSCSSLLTIDPHRGRICLSWTMKPSPCSAISSLHRWIDIACKNINCSFSFIFNQKMRPFYFIAKCLKCEVSIIEKYTSYVRLLWAGQGIFPVFPCWQDTNPLDPIAFSSRKCQKRRLARFVSTKSNPEKKIKNVFERKKFYEKEGISSHSLTPWINVMVHCIIKYIHFFIWESQM